MNQEKQLTLEEKAEKYSEEWTEPLSKMAKECFIAGANYQASISYSKEDIFSMVNTYLEYLINPDSNKELTGKQWIEEFLKTYK